MLELAKRLVFIAISGQLWSWQHHLMNSWNTNWYIVKIGRDFLNLSTDSLELSTARVFKQTRLQVNAQQARYCDAVLTVQ